MRDCDEDDVEVRTIFHDHKAFATSIAVSSCVSESIDQSAVWSNPNGSDGWPEFGQVAHYGRVHGKKP